MMNEAEKLTRVLLLCVAGLALALAGGPGLLVRIGLGSRSSNACSSGGASNLGYFSLGALLLGSLTMASTRPIFGEESLFYRTVGDSLSAVGCIVGGCVAVLLPRQALAASLGALLGIPLLLAAPRLGLDPGLAPDASGSALESALALAVYAGLSTLAAYLTASRLFSSNNNRRVIMTMVEAEIVTFSAAGAWLFVLGLDQVMFETTPLWSRVKAATRPQDTTVGVEEAADTAGALLFGWVVLSLVLCLGQLAAAGLVGGGGLAALLRRVRLRNGAGYRSIGGSNNDNHADDVKKKKPPSNPDVSAGSAQHTALLNERPPSFNVFDPEKLPLRLRRFSTPVFASAEAVGNFFGFQDDSVRNQAEHALMLLANVKSQHERTALDNSAVSSGDALAVNRALRSLHAKIFSNYRQWCASLETRPQFAPAPESSRDAGGAALDIVLWLCVWGEAANLRHMPECLCFLYHSAANEWASTPKRERHGASLYQGHWLDAVVEPVYVVIKNSLAKKSDHYQKLNYDDFNEFFWSKDCLDCHYASGQLSSTAAQHLSQRKRGKKPADEEAGADVDSLASRLMKADKTYLEVRTWLHVLYAFRRVFEYHVFTFQILMVLGFSTFLVWDLAYTLQVASCTAVTLNLMSLLWSVLEVRMLPPAKQESAHAAAVAARLATRFIVLAYQVVFLCWAFDSMEQMPMGTVRGLEASGGLGHLPNKSNETDVALFWWWQHVWLSSVVLFFYGIEMLLQLWPWAMTYLHQLSGDGWVSIMAVFVPSSLLYVGKSVHEPYSNARRYHTFWITLVALKLLFGWHFLVRPMIQPTVEIYDDYLNFPKTRNRGLKSMAQLTGRWTPPMLIYLMDSAIWFSLWSASVGVLVGVRQKLGIVRDISAMRETFLLLPSAFCAKLLSSCNRTEPMPETLSPPSKSTPPSEMEGLQVKKQTRLPPLDDRVERSMEETSCFCDERPGGAKKGKTIQLSSQKELSAIGLGAAGGTKTPRLPSFLNLTDALKAPSARAGLLGLLEDGSNTIVGAWNYSGTTETTTGEEMGAADESRWVLFAEAWNVVIAQMRLSDSLSDGEVDCLLFDSFKGCSKPVYLPIFVTAGAVERASLLAAEAAAVYRPLAEQAAAIRAESLLEGGNGMMGEVEAAGHKKRLEAKMRETEQKLSEQLSADLIAAEAVDEVRELATRLIVRLLGPVHSDDLVAIVSILDRWCREARGLEMTRLEDVHSKFLLPLAQLCALLTSPSKKKKQKKEEPPQEESENSTSADCFLKQSTAAAAAAAAAAAGNMKRTQSTSGLVHMNQQSNSENKNSTKKYSLASNKYMSSSKAKIWTSLVVSEQQPDAFRDAVRDKMRTMLTALKTLVGGKSTQARELVDRLTFVLANERGFFWDSPYATARLDALAADQAALSRTCRKLKALIASSVRATEPRGVEANRRLTFFVNSLLMELPQSPSVETMNSLSILTPFYAEDVIMGKSELLAKNSDGVSTLLYLQTLYKQDWDNFVERRRIKSDGDSEELFGEEHELETRLWASFRAQTLARTVEGMMHNESALRLLARLERARRLSSGLDSQTPAQIEESIKLKFGYVVSCQVYGKQRKNDDPKAQQIDQLLRRFPGLRVAYIDEVRLTRAGAMAFYSVLVKANVEEGVIEEVFRVRLPGNPVIGEGKPENQNHAMVFTRGQYLQTIDMNQDSSFEEALKTRNVLEEFTDSDDAPAGKPPTVIVGLREHIFTGSVSSLANYMALQELSFVTLGQRVLSDPLRMRLHYGHPDVFDKVWFATRGGVSKASKGINLSEDIFAGYTAMIRGGGITFKEYAQVGKGRDVGMQQIYKFEAKLSQGNAEQCLSRDVSRIAQRLDFPRLLSYYFGGIGHYINSALTVFTIQIATYLALLLAVYDAESIGGRLVVPLGPIQIVLAGLGLINTLPLLATLTVERGLAQAARDILQVFISGGPFYFVFHIQTRAHYFTQTLLAGGATYRATGRGFVTRHSGFDEQYRFFASSHLYLAVELAAALILMGIHSESLQYLPRTWSLWLATLSFMLAPFWFNPLGFAFPHVTDDFRKWTQWIFSTTAGGTAEDSWEKWWREETHVYRRLPVQSKFLVGTKTLLYLALARGLVFTGKVHTKQLQSFGVWVGLLLVLWALLRLIDHASRCLSYGVHRLCKMLLGVGLLVLLGAGLLGDKSFVRFSAALYYAAAAANILGCLLGVDSVKHLQRVHDLLVGCAYFAVFLPLSALHVFDVIQTWLLFHNALSQGVVVDDILKQARRSQETSKNNPETEIRELRRIVDEQQRQLAELLENSRGNNTNGAAVEMTPAIEPTNNNIKAEESEEAAMIAEPKPKVANMPRATSSATLSTFDFRSPSAMPPRV